MKQLITIFLLTFVMVSAFPISVSADDDCEQPYLDLQTQTVYSTCTASPGTSPDPCLAICPEGTVLTGGGINIWSHSEDLKVVLAAPYPEENGFRCSVRNESSNDLFFYCYAICLYGDVWCGDDD